MSIWTKVFGIVICVIGIGIWYTDYLIFAAIGALTNWIAESIGITGHAVLGVQVIGWILTFSIMVSLFVLGAVVILGGLGVIED